MVKLRTGKTAGVGQGADGAAGHIVADGIEQIQVFHAPLAVGDAVDDAVQPAGTFAAGGALAAGFFVVEIAQALKRFDHAHVFVHHDNRAGAEHGAGFGDGVVIHIQPHHNFGGQHRRGRAAGDHGFEFFAVFHTAGHFQDFGKRCTQRHFVVARALDMAGDGKQLGAAGVFNAFVGKSLTAVADDKGDRRKGFGVVDGGWACRIGRRMRGTAA